MLIGIPKEVKKDEHRVGLTPAGVSAFNENKHAVMIQKNAGIGSGYSNNDYVKAGATIVKDANDIYSETDMIIKVKEPIPEEYNLIKPGQILFTYFHFASNKNLTIAMLERNITAIAYETVQLDDGSLPLLAPMSEIAGRMAGQLAAHYLNINYGGKGNLIGAVTGVNPANILIIGAGNAGANAAKICSGMGGNTNLFDINLKRLRYLNDIMPDNVNLLYFTEYEFKKALSEADVVIGTIYLPGAKTPKIITREMIKTLQPKTILIDVCVDQGGCSETSHPTTHSKPTFTINEVVHYCVANMPGAFPQTSTIALSNATLKYGLEIANNQLKNIIYGNSPIAKGINMINGKVTCKPVSEAHNLNYYPLKELI